MMAELTDGVPSQRVGVGLTIAKISSDLALSLPALTLVSYALST